jgi:RimJ/RimL family protein N-acetyltransferase
VSFAIVTGWDDVVGTYVHTRLGSRWVPNSGTGIGLVDAQGQLVAGVTYTNFNGSNVCLDVVAERRGWCAPEFLYCWFSYPFEQLGCQRITAQVASNNPRSLKFVERLGFQYEARLDRAVSGGDIFIYRMFKDNCRWLVTPEQFPKVYHNG